jgi:hypothetical protein
LPTKVQSALSHGWTVLNGAQLKPLSVMPGFEPTRGILPVHDANLPLETADSLAAQVSWAAGFLNVIDILPYVALSYAMVEFFILRPNLDWYKEDVEQEPGRVVMETVVTTGVRVGVFAVLAAITTILFGGNAG